MKTILVCTPDQNISEKLCPTWVYPWKTLLSEWYNSIKIHCRVCKHVHNVMERNKQRMTEQFIILMFQNVAEYNVYKCWSNLRKDMKTYHRLLKKKNTLLMKCLIKKCENTSGVEILDVYSFLGFYVPYFVCFYITDFCYI